MLRRNVLWVAALIWVGSCSTPTGDPIADAAVESSADVAVQGGKDLSGPPMNADTPVTSVDVALSADGPSSQDVGAQDTKPAADVTPLLPDTAPDLAPVCAKTVCGAMCIDTSNDPKNCGRCGRDCEGTTCTDGMCAVKDLIDVKNVVGLASSDYVYWTTRDDAGYLQRVSKKGGTAERVGTIHSAGQVAVDAKYAYLSTDDNVELAAPMFRLPLQPGGTFEKIADSGPGVSVIRMNSTSVFVAGSLTATYFYQFSKLPGTKLAFIANDPNAADQFAVNESHLFFIREKDIIRAAINGSMDPVKIVHTAGADDSVFGVAADASHVYFSGTKIGRVPVGGGTAETAVTGRKGSVIASDAKNLYWVSCTSNVGPTDIFTAPKGKDQAAVLLGTDRTCVKKLTLDETGVVWVGSSKVSLDLSIRRVAK